MKTPRKSLPEPQESSLRKAEKNLTKALKRDSPGLIAGGIVHDLNTILTLIYGYSELALEGLDPASENYRNIKKIIQSADRAKAITGQLHPPGKETEQVQTKVTVIDLLLETLDFLRPSVTEGIIIKEEILTPGVCVSADPAQLYRVFINLAGNAIQAMEARGGTLTVTLDTRKGDEAGSLPAGKLPADEYVLIRFEDTGPGMDEKTAGRMFEPFFTAGKPGRERALAFPWFTELSRQSTVKYQ